MRLCRDVGTQVFSSDVDDDVSEGVQLFGNQRHEDNVVLLSLGLDKVVGGQAGTDATLCHACSIPTLLLSLVLEVLTMLCVCEIRYVLTCTGLHVPPHLQKENEKGEYHTVDPWKSSRCFCSS